jgi:autotransporter-associated beta strand protein
VGGPLSINGSAVQGGHGGGGSATAGRALGSGIFLGGSGVLTFAPASGEAVLIGDAIADEAGSGGSGTWALVKTGAGTLTLSGANTYTGGTTVQEGILHAGVANVFGSGGLTVAAGATAALNGFDQALGAISGGGNITLGSALLTTGHATDTTFSGVISGTGGLVKQGTGGLTLSGANTYSGGTTVVGGTLAGTTTSLRGDILNHASVVFDQASAGTYSGAMSGAGSLTKSGTGTVTLTGANTYTGGTTVAGGTLAGTTTSLQGNILNHASVVLEQGFDGTYAGAMSGAGSLTKSGAGTVTLTGVNTYSGGTTVVGGTLAGTTASLQGDILNHASVVFDQASAGTYSGAMRGTGSLTKSGNRTVEV